MEDSQLFDEGLEPDQEKQPDDSARASPVVTEPEAQEEQGDESYSSLAMVDRPIMQNQETQPHFLALEHPISLQNLESSPCLHSSTSLGHDGNALLPAPSYESALVVQHCLSLSFSRSRHVELLFQNDTAVLTLGDQFYFFDAESAQAFSALEDSPILQSQIVRSFFQSLDGQLPLLAIEGPPSLLAIEAPPRLLAIEGPPRLLAIEAPPRLLAIEGPPRLLAIETPTRLLTIENSPLLTHFSTFECSSQYLENSSLVSAQDVGSFLRDLNARLRPTVSARPHRLAMNVGPHSPAQGVASSEVAFDSRLPLPAVEMNTSESVENYINPNVEENDSEQRSSEAIPRRSRGTASSQCHEEAELTEHPNAASGPSARYSRFSYGRQHIILRQRQRERQRQRRRRRRIHRPVLDWANWNLYALLIWFVLYLQWRWLRWLFSMRH